jgi:pimeloyl-ACP methyl ester carboxylesterase
MTELRHLEVDGRRLAYRLREGRSPAIVFLPGYASDMEGAKALALDALAERQGLAILRFDYSGTGSSEGRFEEGTLGGWLDEALFMLDHLTEGPVILAGSSMGGWIALHVALHRPARIAGLIGIAAAPDFTDWGYSDDQKAVIRESGRLELPNPYGPEPHLITRGFWQSGEALRLLHAPIAIDCPVRLIHGDADAEVPLPIALRLLEKLRSADVQLTVIKGGEHRLSKPNELDTIVRVVATLTGDEF